MGASCYIEKDSWDCHGSFLGRRKQQVWSVASSYLFWIFWREWNLRATENDEHYVQSLKILSSRYLLHWVKCYIGIFFNGKSIYRDGFFGLFQCVVALFILSLWTLEHPCAVRFFLYIWFYLLRIKNNNTNGVVESGHWVFAYILLSGITWGTHGIVFGWIINFSLNKDNSKYVRH